MRIVPGTLLLPVYTSTAVLSSSSGSADLGTSVCMRVVRGTLLLPVYTNTAVLSGSSGSADVL